MKNTIINAERKADTRKVWPVNDYTLNFTNKDRYKKAVKILMKSEKYKLLKNGRYLYGNEYGYVTFISRE